MKKKYTSLQKLREDIDIDKSDFYTNKDNSIVWIFQKSVYKKGGFASYRYDKFADGTYNKRPIKKELKRRLIKAKQRKKR